MRFFCLPFVRRPGVQQVSPRDEGKLFLQYLDRATYARTLEAVLLIVLDAATERIWISVATRFACQWVSGCELRGVGRRIAASTPLRVDDEASLAECVCGQ